MFKVGDEAICVTLVRPCCGIPINHQKVENDPFPPPEVGRHYIVTKVGSMYCGQCLADGEGVGMVGFLHPEFAWPAGLFRKPVVDEDKETLVIRVPKKETEDV